ncbi:MAG: hypothetical protein A3H42_01075 [Deltaproteobacteria bacterium RIFCSPLOWO2_02_FULL_46_8]|nr:MAG: hypothetical protein A3H42_01075 [Deltaproteobacteria bacterium RIFCSPLOWO2_02_FULL_46_8]
MSTPLPLETTLPPWLEPGASPLEFGTAVAQLEQSLEGLVIRPVEFLWEQNPVFRAKPFSRQKLDKT